MSDRSSTSNKFEFVVIAGARANSKLEQEAVKEVRRAVDYLQSRDDVNDDQIGYVGWSELLSSRV